MTPLVVEPIRRGVAAVCLNRPEKRNALSDDLAAALIQEIEALNADPQVRVILLHGAGKSFCAGGDLERMAELGKMSAVELHEAARMHIDLFSLSRRLTKPLVGAVHGSTMGGGVGLCAMCHVAVAEKSARFALPEISVGLFPFLIAPVVIDAVGYREAFELALTGRVFPADEARRMGLVQRLVEEGQALSAAREIAEEIAGRSPLALKLGFEAFGTTRVERDAGLLAALSALRNVCFASEDLGEGTRAFLEKRAPVWTGR